MRGKIVVCLQGAPASFPSTARAHYSTLVTKAQNAAQHGAVGLLILVTGERNWATQTRVTSAGFVRWIDPSGTPANVSSLRGVAYISRSGAAAYPLALHEGLMM